jgi:hypothetical protein
MKNKTLSTELENDPLRQMKPIYSLIQGLYLSLFSRKFYVDVVQRWPGIGASFLLVVCFLFALPFSWIEANKVKNYYHHLVEPALNLMPTVILKNGQASLDKPMPYVIKNKKE